MLKGNGAAPKVVVGGGSLGGLFNAIALRSLGVRVDVFEKSSGLMKDRGAGIVFQQEVADLLTRYEVAPDVSLRSTACVSPPTLQVASSQKEGDRPLQSRKRLPLE